MSDDKIVPPAKAGEESVARVIDLNSSSVKLGLTLLQAVNKKSDELTAERYAYYEGRIEKLERELAREQNKNDMIANNIRILLECDLGELIYRAKYVSLPSSQSEGTQ